MSTLARLALIVSLVGCVSNKDVCAPFGLVEDPILARCVCPDGFVMDDDAGACVGPDGSVIRYDAGPLDGVDGGVDSSTSCVVGTDGCECEEGTSRACEGGNAVGACSPGTQRCEEGRWSGCEGRVDPAPETCNGADDDCNGVPDDGSARTSCGTPPRGVVTGCSGGGCFVETCADGFLDCDAEFENGCESELGTATACLSCGDVCGWSCEDGGCNDATQVVAGAGFTLVLREDQTLVGSGDNEFGQLADGSNGERVIPSRSFVASVDDLSAGPAHACAIIAGETWCWGNNDFRQLGDGTEIDRNRPVRALATSRAVAAGPGHTCALRTDESVWCWGGGSPPRSMSPTRVLANGLGATDVAAGADHTCALFRSGDVRCWGTNNQGALGVGSSEYVSSSTPMAVVDLDDATEIAAGGYTTCVIRLGGAVSCWGQVNGVAAVRPQPVAGLSSVRRIAVGTGNVCAIREDESLWCFGLNTNGEVGDGTSMFRSSPVRVLEGVADVSFGTNHTCAVLTDGGVRCWGNNDTGQLGTGDRDPSLLPVQVSPPR